MADNKGSATAPPSAEFSAILKAAEIGVEAGSLMTAMLEQSDDCIKMLNVDGTLEYMNCGGLKAMQIDEFSSVAGEKWWNLWPENRRNNLPAWRTLP